MSYCQKYYNFVVKYECLFFCPFFLRKKKGIGFFIKLRNLVPASNYLVVLKSFYFQRFFFFNGKFFSKKALNFRKFSTKYVCTEVSAKNQNFFKNFDLFFSNWFWIIKKKDLFFKIFCVDFGLFFIFQEIIELGFRNIPMDFDYFNWRSKFMLEVTSSFKYFLNYVFFSLFKLKV